MALSTKTRVPIKTKDYTIKVIRKKKININFWSSLNKDDDLYYSSVMKYKNRDKHCIYSFFNETASKNCLSFLEQYYKIYNKYPELYGQQFQKYNDTMEVYIEDETLENMRYRCLLNNIGLVGISSFEYIFLEKFLDKKNIFDISINAVDLLENEEIDVITHIDHLNYLLDF